MTEIAVKNGWAYCPVCHNKTRTKIRPDTKARNLIIYCPVCKTESVADVEDNKIKYA